MNRSDRSYPTGDLPPRRPAGRTRMLFVALDGMGWSTQATAMAATTARRDDIDAVHIRYRGDGLKRVLSAPVPGGRGRLDSHVRRIKVARWVLSRWIRGPLDLRHFDVVHVAPQQYAWAFAEVPAMVRPVLSVTTDATVFQAKGTLMDLDSAEVLRRFRPLVQIEQAVFASADLVVANSRWAGAEVIDRFGVDPATLVVSPCALPPPVNGVRPHATPTNAQARIAFVGKDWHRKGGDRLLRWHQERWSDRAILHLFTAHSPPASCRNVVHHGLVPHERVLALLPSMDLFVLPTRKDMSPLALLEASSVGLPVVSSRIGGIEELVVDGVSGFLCGSDDDEGFVQSIERLLENPELRRSMGEAGRRGTDIANRNGMSDDDVLDRLIELAATRRR